MKIFIAADEPKLSGKIAKRLGHASYYLIYHTEDAAFEVIENNEEDENHQLLVDLVNNDIKIFIVGNIGPDAFSILQSGKANVFLARRMTVEDAIDSYLNNGLEELSEPTVKKSFHHHH